MATTAARELETAWEDGALVLRRPPRAYRRRGVIALALSPLVLVVLVPTLVWFDDVEDPTIGLLLGLCCLALPASLLAGVVQLTFASTLSARTRWVLRRAQAPDGNTEVLATGRRGALTHRLTSAHRASADVKGMLGDTYQLLLYDPWGRQVGSLSEPIHQTFRAELDAATLEVNRLLGHATQATGSADGPGAPAALPQLGNAQGTTTPGERSLAMLCYLPVQGIFLIVSLGCLVASRSQYARSAAKQSLLQFVFSLCVLTCVLVVLGVPTALLDDASPIKLVFAGVLALALFSYLAWNLGAHIYACIRFYQGRPWVMPWLRPVARRWFE
ncbi:MAG: hypothetical protein R3B07_08515 [Polyangiaceae bacterium]